MTATMEAATYTVPRDQFWAQGCERCRFGILYPIPALRNDRPLYQERLAQYHAGELRPCNCAAGENLADWLGATHDNEQQYQDTLAALPAKLAERRNETIFANHLTNLRIAGLCQILVEERIERVERNERGVHNPSVVRRAVAVHHHIKNLAGDGVHQFLDEYATQLLRAFGLHETLIEVVDLALEVSSAQDEVRVAAVRVDVLERVVNRVTGQHGT